MLLPLRRIWSTLVTRIPSGVISLRRQPPVRSTGKADSKGGDDTISLVHSANHYAALRMCGRPELRFTKQGVGAAPEFGWIPISLGLETYYSVTSSSTMLT
jgi:hypothetical protein